MSNSALDSRHCELALQREISRISLRDGASMCVYAFSKATSLKSRSRYWEDEIDGQNLAEKFEELQAGGVEEQASEFIAFLEWLIDRSRAVRPESGVRKLSTIKQYWKDFQMLWRDCMKFRIDKDVNDQIKLVREDQSPLHQRSR